MTTFHPSSDVIVAHLAGEAVLLHLGSKRYFRLNDSAAAIWKGIESGSSHDAIADALLAEFDVDRDTAAREITRVLDALQRDALISPVA